MGNSFPDPVAAGQAEAQLRAEGPDAGRARWQPLLPPELLDREEDWWQPETAAPMAPWPSQPKWEAVRGGLGGEVRVEIWG